jgi:hypothetical protein
MTDNGPPKCDEGRPELPGNGPQKASLVGSADGSANSTKAAPGARDHDGGARCGFLQKFEGTREPGGYSKGFHGWPLARRNAWFAGFNKGSVGKKNLGVQDD